MDPQEVTRKTTSEVRQKKGAWNWGRIGLPRPGFGRTPVPSAPFDTEPDLGVNGSRWLRCASTSEQPDCGRLRGHPSDFGPPCFSDACGRASKRSSPLKPNICIQRNMCVSRPSRSKPPVRRSSPSRRPASRPGLPPESMARDTGDQPRSAVRAGVGRATPCTTASTSNSARPSREANPRMAWEHAASCAAEHPGFRVSFPAGSALHWGGWRNHAR